MFELAALPAAAAECPRSEMGDTGQCQAPLGNTGQRWAMAINSNICYKSIFISAGQYWATFINSGHYCTVLGDRKNNAILLIASSPTCRVLAALLVDLGKVRLYKHRV